MLRDTALTSGPLTLVVDFRQVAPAPPLRQAVCIRLARVGCGCVCPAVTAAATAASALSTWAGRRKISSVGIVGIAEQQRRGWTSIARIAKHQRRGQGSRARWCAGWVCERRGEQFIVIILVRGPILQSNIPANGRHPKQMNTTYLSKRAMGSHLEGLAFLALVPSSARPSLLFFGGMICVHTDTVSGDANATAGAERVQPVPASAPPPRRRNRQRRRRRNRQRRRHQVLPCRH